MYTFDQDRRYNLCYDRPIVAPIHIKPVYSSVSYQWRFLRNTVVVAVNRLVGMGLKGKQNPYSGHMGRVDMGKVGLWTESKI